MDQKENKNEILEEQKRARKEFLELKKMQQENKSEGESKQPSAPLSFKEKILNFWYYYKVAVIIGLIVVGALIYISVQTANKPKSDLKVVIYDSRIVPDAYLGDVQEYLEGFCKDYNGDGEVIVTVMNCTYEAGSSSAQYQQTIQQKLGSIIVADKETMIFITSDTGYDYLQSIVETPFLKEEALELSKDFYDSIEETIGVGMPKGYKVYCREIKGTLIENDETANESLKRAQEFLSAVK